MAGAQLPEFVAAIDVVGGEFRSSARQRDIAVAPHVLVGTVIRT